MTFDNFIDGIWTPSRSRSTFPDENPAFRGSSLGRFQSSTAEDVSNAVAAAARVFPRWRRTPLGERQRHVAEFLRLLRESREEIARIVTLENGKTIRESRAEVDSALVEGSYHLEHVASFFASPDRPEAGAMKTWVEYTPLGVVGLISPWNFPMNVMCRKALPALLTGNTVVFKPASFTPWSGVFMAQLFQRAGLPAGVFNCVTGPGAAMGAAIVQDPRVRAVSFTGSTAVGKAIQAMAAAHLTRTQLELGGKNALIVMDDADVDGALDAAMTAGFSNAGQWCTSTSRLLLQRGVAKPFLDALAERCAGLTVGDGLVETTDMGPVAGPHQYRDVCAAIRRAIRDGARLLVGDDEASLGSDSTPGYFVRPTVFVDVTPDMSLFREEVFGPVLAVCVFDSLADALEMANDSVYGLSSAIFTRDTTAAAAYVDQIEAGLAHVNVHTGYKEPSLPFGGVKQSGAGPPENGRTGLEFFVDRKAVYERV